MFKLILVNKTQGLCRNMGHSCYYSFHRYCMTQVFTHIGAPTLENHSIAESANTSAKLNKHIQNIESISLKLFNIYLANQPAQVANPPS